MFNVTQDRKWCMENRGLGLSNDINPISAGLFWLSMTGGRGWIPLPLENNVPVELGQ